MFTYNGTIYVYSILEQLMIYNINLKTAKPHTVYVTSIIESRSHYDFTVMQDLFLCYNYVAYV